MLVLPHNYRITMFSITEESMILVLEIEIED
jgi:hypothetical protein